MVEGDVLPASVLAYGATSRCCYELRRGAFGYFYLEVLDKISNDMTRRIYMAEDIARKAIQDLWNAERRREASRGKLPS